MPASKITRSPKHIFLMDAIGALLTCLFLMVILKPLEVHFGMPIDALNLLAGIAFFLFLYSSCCAMLLKKSWKPFLLAIILLNTLYALISIGVIIQNFSPLTELGLIYFALEFIVIGIVVSVEIKSYRILADKT